MRDDLAHFAVSTDIPQEGSPLSLILSTLNRFPTSVRQLKRRYDDHAPLKVSDEYDIQDPIYALLTSHFNDIKAGECIPSFTSTALKQSFLLRKEKIVTEMKKTRESLGADKAGGEPLTNMACYRAHQDCDTLILLVYDPDCYINSPLGARTDLESKDARGKMKVIIAQL